MSIKDKLKKAIKTTEERGKVYGHDGSEVTGRAIAMLFPDGLTLKTPNDFARFAIFNMIMAKVGRYAKNFSKGGHQDSVHDIGVYSFILEELDDTCNRKRQQPRPKVNEYRPERLRIHRHGIKRNGVKKKHRQPHQGNTAKWSRF